MICRSVILLLFLSLQTAFSQTLQLPFFEDFSTTTGPYPDSKLWINGGTFVNNTFAINQPGKYVTTFDGRNAKGVPYNYINQLSYGGTDSLTSRPINLEASVAADSLYLSFYWQAKGIGELPDEDDTLIVSFLNKSKKWIPVWKQQGNVKSDLFFQQLIAIKDTAYLHANFQFRFEAKGRQSGAFDTWHVDYIYLNKNRSRTDIYSKDIACTRFTSSYLRRYSAMPLRQYLVNPAAEVNDTVRAEMFNLQPIGDFTRYAWKIEDVVSGRVYYDAPGTSFGSLPPKITGTRQLVFQPVTSFNSNRAILKFQFNITTSDAFQPDLPGFDLTVNDSISTYTILDDFYAYDDGTAEIGADFDQNLGKVAVQYVLSKPDSIGAVMINFSPYFNNPATAKQNFILEILDNEKGRPGKTLYQESGDSVRAVYGNTPNYFKTYSLKRNVAIKDTFYVSWTKLTQEVIAVGVDKNTPRFASKIFYNNGTSWLRNTSLKGSLMVRPVLATKPAVVDPGMPSGGITATEKPFGEPLVIYPNPTSGVLKWNVQGIRHISIFDASGREIIARKVEGQELNISNLPDGLYFINFSDGRKNLIQKIMVLH